MKRLWILCFALAVAAATGLAADGRLFYSREFPGSTPPYIQLTLTKGGDAEYKEAIDDELPIKFKLDAQSTQTMWGLAEKLDFFKHPIESPAKVAFMGKKTFKVENGDPKSQVQYNYSDSKDAQALQEWFEKMAQSAQLHIDLERTVKYDRLGVVKSLMILESAIQDDRVVGLEQYLPLLDRIIANENFMHTARARASEIAEAIRAVKPQ